MSPQFVARDGALFTNEGECRDYEFARLPKLLAGLTEAQVAKALARDDEELAELFEEAGKRITTRRLKNGDYKRKPKATGVTSATQPAPDADDPPQFDPLNEPAPGEADEDARAA